MNTRNLFGTPLGAYYFSSVQRYKTFFQDYRVTSDDLIGINDGSEVGVYGPYSRLAFIRYVRPKYLREPIPPELGNVNVDVYYISESHTVNSSVIGEFYVTRGALQKSATELPFDKMYFRISKSSYVNGNPRKDYDDIAKKMEARIRNYPEDQQLTPAETIFANKELSGNIGKFLGRPTSRKGGRRKPKRTKRTKRTRKNKRHHK
jgi:hypothetical protein